MASVTPGEPDWPRNWGKSRGESAVMAEEAPASAGPRGRRWETGGAGRDGQCQQRAEQALFQLHGATSFLHRSGRPGRSAANKKRAGFRLSIPRSGDAAPLRLGRDFPPKSACPRVRQVSWLEFHLLAFRLPRGYPVTEAPAWPGLPESFRPSHSSGGCRGFAPRSLFIRCGPGKPGATRNRTPLFDFVPPPIVAPEGPPCQGTGAGSGIFSKNR